jgi:hypothetical protein
VYVSVMRKTTVFVGAFAVAAACSGPPAPAPGSGAASNSRGGPLDDTVHVALGSSVRADNGRLVLTFNARLGDSRCPANAVCVWMGDAAIRVAARVGRVGVERELHTALEPRTLSIDDYVITIVGLTPYPGTDDRSTPTAILRVVRS